MSNEIITQVLGYLIKAFFLFFTAVLTYWIKTKVIPWLEDRQLYTTVKRYVQAAEKLASTGEIGKGAAKTDYVISLLESKGIVCGPEVLALIESACEELDKAAQQALSAFIGGATMETVNELSNGKGPDDE